MTVDTLEGEITDHPGDENGERAEAGRRENYRNGHRAMTVTTDIGTVEIEVPRDRAGTFEPMDPTDPAWPRHRFRSLCPGSRRAPGVRGCGGRDASPRLSAGGGSCWRPSLYWLRCGPLPPRCRRRLPICGVEHVARSGGRPQGRRRCVPPPSSRPARSAAEVEVVPGAVCGGVDVVARGGVDVGGAHPGTYARGPGVSEVDDGLAVGAEGEVLRVRGVPLAA